MRPYFQILTHMKHPYIIHCISLFLIGCTPEWNNFPLKENEIVYRTYNNSKIELSIISEDQYWMLGNADGARSVLKSNKFYKKKGYGILTFTSAVRSLSYETFGKGISKVSDIILPEGLYSIEDGCFSHNKNINVYVPSTVSEISKNAFRGILSVSISPENQWYYAYDNAIIRKQNGELISAGMSTSNIADGVKILGKGAFYENNTRVIRLPKSLRAIRSYAFGKNLASIVFPDHIDSICEFAFYGCSKLEQVKFPKTAQHIGKKAFEGCYSLTKIQFPKGCDSIPESCFEDCQNVNNIRLPEGLKEIHHKAFYNCGRTHILIIPESVQLIENEAFWKTDFNYLVFKNPHTKFAYFSFMNIESIENKTLCGDYNKILYYTDKFKTLDDIQAYLLASTHDYDYSFESKDMDGILTYIPNIPAWKNSYRDGIFWIGGNDYDAYLYEFTDHTASFRIRDNQFARNDIGNIIYGAVIDSSAETITIRIKGVDFVFRKDGVI